jgi:hypothetical protein
MAPAMTAQITIVTDLLKEKSCCNELPKDEPVSRGTARQKSREIR